MPVHRSDPRDGTLQWFRMGCHSTLPTLQGHPWHPRSSLFSPFHHVCCCHCARKFHLLVKTCEITIVVDGALKYIIIWYVPSTAEGILFLLVKPMFCVSQSQFSWWNHSCPWSIPVFNGEQANFSLMKFYVLNLVVSLVKSNLLLIS